MKSPGKHNTTVILMSTYNGARHVRQQLASILSQLEATDEIFIRDDGSSDETVSIIESMSDSRIRLERGKNMGFARSFFWLLYNASLTHSMYMLADQDDVWLPGKVVRAASVLRHSDGPHLYCTRLQLVNSDLKPIGYSPNFSKAPTFWNALCENIATGCTIAINPAALSLIRIVPYEQLAAHRITYHDWWLYLCISAFGTVTFDSKASILYRQHGANMVGMGSGLKRYTNIIKLLLRAPWAQIMIIQMKAFQKFYGKDLSRQKHLDAENLRGLLKGSKLKIVVNFIRCPYFVRQSFGGVALLKCLLLIEYLSGRIDIENRASK